MISTRATDSRWDREEWPDPNPGDDPECVAIVGKAGNGDIVPWGEKGWEIWGLNERTVGPRIGAHTRWFQLHPPAYLGKHHPPGLEDLATNWGRKRGVTLYMDAHYSEYPDSVAYPRKAVEAMTPHGGYHASSFDWMLALAILEGFKTIRLYNCVFTTFPYLNKEPISARPCLEYWAGVAEGRGAEVRVIDSGDTFKIVHLAKMASDLQYGFEREPGHDLRYANTGWVDLR